MPNLAGVGILPNIKLQIPTKKSMSMTIGAIEKSLQINVRLTKIKERILADLQIYINSQRKRDVETHTEDWRYTARNNLYNVIEASTTLEQTRSNRWRLGIGEYGFLNKHAPYWYVINYGGLVPNPAYGYFGKGRPPRAGGGREVFHFTGKKGTVPAGYTGKEQKPFYMIPKVPIPPMYYLNRMRQSLEEELVSIDAAIKETLNTA